MDIIQPDTCAAGGLSECKKIADMAVAFGTRYNPHVWGTGIAIAASLQLLAVLPPHTPPSLASIEPMLEFDRTEHPIRQALLTRPIEPVRGIARVPDGPGLGIEVDREALARFSARGDRVHEQVSRSSLSGGTPGDDQVHVSVGAPTGS
jgi:D-galactarolactone cycloisomerase